MGLSQFHSPKTACANSILTEPVQTDRWREDGTEEYEMMGNGRERKRKIIQNKARQREKKKKKMAQHKVSFSISKESLAISVHAGTAAYHAYRCTATASTSLSTAYFSLDSNCLLWLSRGRPKRIACRICCIHKHPMARQRQDSTYCSVPFSCLSGRRKRVRVIVADGTRLNKTLRHSYCCCWQKA